MTAQLITGLLVSFNLLHCSPAATHLPMENKPLEVLTHTLNTTTKFVKAHAAEYLIWTGHANIALKAYLDEEKQFGTEPKYRVVIWRVLIQAETDPARKKLWLDKMYAAYYDMDGPDRTHATESLAKLKQPVAKLFPAVTAKTLASTDRNLQTYALWASSYGSKTSMDANRKKLLEMALTDENVIIRKISSFVLRKEQGLSVEQWNKIADAALATDKSSDVFVTYLTTALVTAPTGADAAKLDKVNTLLSQNVGNYKLGELNELALALAEKGNKSHLPLLNDMLADKFAEGKYDAKTDEAADMRAGAAYAILNISNKK